MSSEASDLPADPTHSLRRQLTLFDSVCIIVGIIVGAGFYESAPVVAGFTVSTRDLIAVWTIGGVVSLLGAICYAELATADPRDGGEYNFLSRAFGRPIGFLFAWVGFWVVRPGNIGAMALVFGKYAGHVLPLPVGPRWNDLIYAMASIVVLSAVHAAGVRPGKWVQNVLTSGKALGLIAVIIVGLCFVTPEEVIDSRARTALLPKPNISIAMILVLFAYGGWNEIAYVAAEVRNPRRNLFRSLVLGVIVVTAIYLLGNAAFLHSLGHDIIAKTPPAATVMRGQFHHAGEVFISLLICISALGAVSGMIFTGSRIFYAVGNDYHPLRYLGRLGKTIEAPIPSLMLQGGVTLALLVGFGFYADGFERLIIFTGPAFYFFFVLTGVALIVLRFREPDMPRPFRVPLYPIPPILFIAATLFMLEASTRYAIEHRTWEALWTLLVSSIGIGLCVFARRKDGPRGFAVQQNS